MARACASADFGALTRMVGRIAASPMASASAASVFWRLANGLTQAGAIRRTRWPSAAIRRAQ